MPATLAISAKDLGRFAMPSFCPKCFWTLWHMQEDPPFSIFPKIFSTIDAFTKRVVHAYFDQHNSPPPWLAGLGDVVGYIDPPGYKSLEVPVKNDVVLRGSPDAVFKMKDGTLMVGDYKTAWYQGVNDPLYPIYCVQLNCYGWLLEQKGYGRVSALKLIYTEPRTGNESLAAASNDEGFALAFQTKFLEVPINPGVLAGYVQRAREVFDLEKSPAGLPGCTDCKRLEDLLVTVGTQASTWAQIAVPKSEWR